MNGEILVRNHQDNRTNPESYYRGIKYVDGHTVKKEPGIVYIIIYGKFQMVLFKDIIQSESKKGKTSCKLEIMIAYQRIKKSGGAEICQKNEDNIADENTQIHCQCRSESPIDTCFD